MEQEFFLKGSGSRASGTEQASPPSQPVPKISNKILTTPHNFTPAHELLEDFHKGCKGECQVIVVGSIFVRNTFIIH